MTKAIIEAECTCKEKMEYIIKKQRKISIKAVEILKITFDILGELHENHVEHMEERLAVAHIVYKYMVPEENIVAAILLYPDYLTHHISLKSLMERFGENRGESIHNIIIEGIKRGSYNSSGNSEHEIDNYFMLEICDQMFSKLLKKLSKKGIPDTSCIWLAYKTAKKYHMGQLRKTGEPYIVHPLKVAMILSDVGVESNIIAAAILHDVVEDTEYKFEEIKNEFGEQIAKYVYAVTSVEKEYAVSLKRDEYASDKYDMDEKTVEKLASYIAKDPRMIFALYIKAADRIHNLSTIDEMSSIKKHNKVDETDTMYLPLFEKFNLNYFTKIIKDLTWRATNIELYNLIKKAYREMYELNAYHIDEVKEYLTDCFSSGYKKFCRHVGCTSDYDFEIEVIEYTPLEIHDMIKGNTAFYESPVKYVQKRYMPVCDFDIVIDTEDEKDTIGSFVTLFIKYYVDHIAGSASGFVITDFSSDKFGRFILNIEDKYRNNIRCCFAMKSDYITYRNGSTRGMFIEAKESTETTVNEVIRIRLRNGREIEMPKGSTVLDAAFAIHEEIGFSAMSALINDKEAQINDILHDGDRVIVIADTAREDGVLKHYTKHARINWIDYAKTPLARKKLIKYLSDRYEGDDPVREANAPVKAVDNVSNQMMRTINVNPKNGEENF